MHRHLSDVLPVMIRVASELEAPQGELPHEMTYVKGVARGVEAAIQREGAFFQALGERVQISAVGMEFTPFEVFDESHNRETSKRGWPVVAQTNLMRRWGKVK